MHLPVLMRSLASRVHRAMRGAIRRVSVSVFGGCRVGPLPWGQANGETQQWARQGLSECALWVCVTGLYSVMGHFRPKKARRVARTIHQRLGRRKEYLGHLVSGAGVR